MHRLLELQSGQPASMDQCPGWPVVVMAVAQQEAAQLLTGLTQAAHRRRTRTQEIADSLMPDLEPRQGSVHRPGAAWRGWSRPAPGSRLAGASLVRSVTSAPTSATRTSPA